jgi:hypothetical protein
MARDVVMADLTHVQPMGGEKAPTTIAHPNTADQMMVLRGRTIAATHKRRTPSVHLAPAPAPLTANGPLLSVLLRQETRTPRFRAPIGFRFR